MNKILGLTSLVVALVLSAMMVATSEAKTTQATALTNRCGSEYSVIVEQKFINKARDARVRVRRDPGTRKRCGEIVWIRTPLRHSNIRFELDDTGRDIKFCSNGPGEPVTVCHARGTGSTKLYQVWFTVHPVGKPGYQTYVLTRM